MTIGAWRPARLNRVGGTDCSSAAGQCLVEARYQVSIVERFGQKTNRACAERLSARPHFGESRNEYDRQAMTLRDQPILQFYSGHTGHLHVGNQAVCIRNMVRFQECFGGVKRGCSITKRSNEARRGAAERLIIIDN